MCERLLQSDNAVKSRMESLLQSDNALKSRVDGFCSLTMHRNCVNSEFCFKKIEEIRCGFFAKA